MHSTSAVKIQTWLHHKEVHFLVLVQTKRTQAEDPAAHNVHICEQTLARGCAESFRSVPKCKHSGRTMSCFLTGTLRPAGPSSCCGPVHSLGVKCSDDSWQRRRCCHFCVFAPPELGTALMFPCF